jgi:hypothetical protein
VPANQATYLGTLYATANGQTAMQFAPAAASGGSNNVLGLWNAYNRVRALSKMRDSAAQWTLATTAWRAADNSNSNRITWVDGLGQSFGEASYFCTTNAAAATDTYVGVSFNAVAAPGIAPFNGGGVSTTRTSDALIAQGLNYAQAMERIDATNTCTFYAGGASQMLTLALDL